MTPQVTSRQVVPQVSVAAERRKDAAHGESRGAAAPKQESPEGRTKLYLTQTPLQQCQSARSDIAKLPRSLPHCARSACPFFSLPAQS
jgi:hypothetical protein